MIIKFLLLGDEKVDNYLLRKFIIVIRIYE